MLESRSALANHLKPGRFGAGTDIGVTLSEVRGRHIFQAAGWPETFPSISKRLAETAGTTVPGAFRLASVADTVTAIWIGAERLWFTTEDAGLLARLAASVDDEEAVLLDLSQSRTIIRVAGSTARAVLAKGVAIDLHADAFPVQAVAQTMVEHAGTLVHRVGPEAFEIYVPRSYAAAIWHSLTVSSAEFGYQVEG